MALLRTLLRPFSARLAPRSFASGAAGEEEENSSAIDADMKDARRVAELFARDLQTKEISEKEKSDTILVENFFTRAIEWGAAVGPGSALDTKTAFTAVRADVDDAVLAHQLRMTAFLARIKNFVIARLRSERLHLVPRDSYDFLAPLPRIAASKQSEARGSFVSLLRNDPLMELGDVRNRLVKGFILEATENHLYVDFGGKFLCVVRRPRTKPEVYVRGTPVILRLQDLEQVSAFMASDKCITLLEAKGTLVERIAPDKAETMSDKASEANTESDTAAAPK